LPIFIRTKRKGNGLRLAGAGLAVVADTLTTVLTGAESAPLGVLLIGGLLAVVVSAGVAVTES